jgi:hypothetical protein
MILYTIKEDSRAENVVIIPSPAIPQIEDGVVRMFDPIDTIRTDGISDSEV